MGFSVVGKAGSRANTFASRPFLSVARKMANVVGDCLGFGPLTPHPDLKPAPTSRVRYRSIDKSRDVVTDTVRKLMTQHDFLVSLPLHEDESFSHSALDELKQPPTWEGENYCTDMATAFGCVMRRLGLDVQMMEAYTMRTSEVRPIPHVDRQHTFLALPIDGDTNLNSEDTLVIDPTVRQFMPDFPEPVFVGTWDQLKDACKQHGVTKSIFHSNWGRATERSHRFKALDKTLEGTMRVGDFDDCFTCLMMSAEDFVPLALFAQTMPSVALESGAVSANDAVE